MNLNVYINLVEQFLVRNLIRYTITIFINYINRFKFYFNILAYLGTLVLWGKSQSQKPLRKF